MRAQNDWHIDERMRAQVDGICRSHPEMDRDAAIFLAIIARTQAVVFSLRPDLEPKYSKLCTSNPFAVPELVAAALLPAS